MFRNAQISTSLLTIQKYSIHHKLLETMYIATVCKGRSGVTFKSLNELSEMSKGDSRIYGRKLGLTNCWPESREWIIDEQCNCSVENGLDVFDWIGTTFHVALSDRKAV